MRERPYFRYLTKQLISTYLAEYYEDQLLWLLKFTIHYPKKHKSKLNLNMRDDQRSSSPKPSKAFSDIPRSTPNTALWRFTLRFTVSLRWTLWHLTQPSFTTKKKHSRGGSVSLSQPFLGIRSLILHPQFHTTLDPVLVVQDQVVGPSLFLLSRPKHRL